MLNFCSIQKRSYTMRFSALACLNQACAWLRLFWTVHFIILILSPWLTKKVCICLSQYWRRILVTIRTGSQKRDHQKICGAPEPSTTKWLRSNQCSGGQMWWHLVECQHSFDKRNFSWVTSLSGSPVGLKDWGWFLKKE